VNSLLLPSRVYCDSLDFERTAKNHASLIARIAWCQRQEIRAHTQAELEKWRAEEEGLRDALLNRDHTGHYRYSPPAVFHRYEMGLEDGRTLIRAARVESMWYPSTN
jgi:hypothetical protein